MPGLVRYCGYGGYQDWYGSLSSQNLHSGWKKIEKNPMLEINIRN